MALESRQYLINGSCRCAVATFRHDRRQSSPAVPARYRRSCRDRLFERARHLVERRIACCVAAAPVDLREITQLDHDYGERSRMPPSPVSLELGGL